MKLLLTSLLLASSVFTQAAMVRDARVNTEKGVIEVDVTYGGGCEKHEFNLELSACRERYPVSCDAKLIHNNNGDSCEAYIFETVEFSLEEYNLNDHYFNAGDFTIFGDNNTHATVILPGRPF